MAHLVCFMQPAHCSSTASPKPRSAPPPPPPQPLHQGLFYARASPHRRLPRTGTCSARKPAPTPPHSAAGAPDPAAPLLPHRRTPVPRFPPRRTPAPPPRRPPPRRPPARRPCTPCGTTPPWPCARTRTAPRPQAGPAPRRRVLAPAPTTLRTWQGRQEVGGSRHTDMQLPGLGIRLAATARAAPLLAGTPTAQHGNPPAHHHMGSHAHAHIRPTLIEPVAWPPAGCTPAAAASAATRPAAGSATAGPP